jgi:hypothetical protein
MFIKVIKVIKMADLPEKTAVLDTPVAPKKKGRTMTVELLEKLKLARERAKELRDQAKKEKENLGTSALTEPEKSKVAKYLATRKLIKKTIQKEIEQELETEIFEPEPELEPAPAPIPQEKNFGSVPPPVKPKAKVKVQVPDSDSDSDDDGNPYTTIKVLKSKLVKYSKLSGKKVEKFTVPEPSVALDPKGKPQPPAKWVNPYSTGHLYNLAASGYRF